MNDCHSSLPIEILKKENNARKIEDRVIIRELLLSIQLCTLLPDHALERIETEVKYEFSAKEEGAPYVTLFEKGEDNILSLYIVLEGNVVLLDGPFDESEIDQYPPLLRGDAFGEESIFMWDFKSRNKISHRLYTAIQISCDLHMLKISDSALLREFWQTCQFQSNGFIFRPNHFLRLFDVEPAGRNEAHMQLISRALPSCEYISSGKVRQDVSRALKQCAASIVLIKAKADSIIYNYNDGSESVFLVLLGTAAIYWNGSSHILMPAPGGVHRKRDGRSRSISKKTEDLGSLVIHADMGFSLGCPQECFNHSECSCDEPDNSSPQPTDPNMLKRRRFCARAETDCGILSIPAAVWDILRENGALSTSLQLAAVAKCVNRAVEQNTLLATYLKFFKNFSAASFDDLLELSSKVHYRQYQAFDIISDDIYFLGPNVRTSHIITSGAVSTHNIRKDGVHLHQFEQHLATLRNQYTKGDFESLKEFHDSALCMAYAGDMLHKSETGATKRESPLKLIANCPADAMLVPADQVCIILEQTGQTSHRMQRYQHVLEIAPEERQTSEIAEIVKMLSAVKIFEHFPQTCQHNLAQVMRARKYSSGDIIFRQGDEANEVFIVLTGLLATKVQLAHRQTRRSPSPQRHRRNSITNSRSPGRSPMGRRLSVTAISEDSIEGQSGSSQAGASKLHASFLRAVRKLQENPDALVALKKSGDVIGDSIFSTSGAKRPSDLVAREDSSVAILTRFQLEEYRDLFISSMVCLDSIRTVVRMNPAIRSDDDLMMLVRLLREAPLFRSQDEQFLVSIARMMTLTTLEKGASLFVENSPCETFCLVLSGKLALCKGAVSHITQEILTADDSGDLVAWEGLLDIVDSGRVIQDCLKRIAVNGPGPHFVFRQGAMWPYSCIALENTEILRIHKHEYEQCISAFQQSEHDSIRAFLSSVLPFKNWKPKDCLQLASSSQALRIDRGTLLFSPGQPAEYLYVIQQGQCALYQEVQQLTQGQSGNNLLQPSSYVGLVGKGMLLGLDVKDSHEQNCKYVHSLGCKADTPCTVILIHRADADDIAGRNYCEQELPKLLEHISRSHLRIQTPILIKQFTKKSQHPSCNTESAVRNPIHPYENPNRKGAVRIALNAAMMSSVEPEPAVISAQALRNDVQRLRSFLQNRYGPVAKALEIMAVKQGSDVLEMKTMTQILKDSGCQVPCLGFLKALQQGENGISFAELKVVLTSQAYLDRVILQSFGHEVLQHVPGTELRRNSINPERTFKVAQRRNEVSALSLLRIDEKRLKPRTNEGAEDKSPIFDAKVQNEMKVRTLVRPKSAIQSSDISYPAAFEPMSSVRPKSAIAIRSQSISLIREMSALPFTKPIRSENSDLDSVQAKILRRYRDEAKSNGSDASFEAKFSPADTKAVSLSESRPSTPNKSLVQAASAMDVLSGTVKARHLELSVHYARAKGVRPVKQNAVEIQKRLEDMTGRHAQISWVRVLRQRNKSRLAELKQHSKDW